MVPASKGDHLNQSNYESFVLRQFRDFYQEVIGLKKRVSEDSWGFGDENGAAETATEDTVDSTRSPIAVWERLLSLLQGQGLTARPRGADLDEDYYREVQYLMAALADEIFVHTSWPGSQAWERNLLETRLFDTHDAGEAIFRRLDEVLAVRDPIHSDLAKLYLHALSLGFQGKFRGTPEGAQRLADYRQGLLDFIAERDSSFDDSVAHLFPAAYSNTVLESTGPKLPSLRSWLWALPAALVVWIGAGWWVWSRLVTDLRPALDRILELP